MYISFRKHVCCELDNKSESNERTKYRTHIRHIEIFIIARCEQFHFCSLKAWTWSRPQIGTLLLHYNAYSQNFETHCAAMDSNASRRCSHGIGLYHRWRNILYCVKCRLISARVGNTITQYAMADRSHSEWSAWHTQTHNRCHFPNTMKASTCTQEWRILQEPLVRWCGRLTGCSRWWRVYADLIHEMCANLVAVCFRVGAEYCWYMCD